MSRTIEWALALAVTAAIAFNLFGALGSRVAALVAGLQP
jgi:hypothetical protein